MVSFGLGQQISLSCGDLSSSLTTNYHTVESRVPSKLSFSSPEQRSQRAIVPPLVAAVAAASTNVKDFKTSLFPNLITDLIHVW